MPVFQTGAVVCTGPLSQNTQVNIEIKLENTILGWWLWEIPQLTVTSLVRRMTQPVASFHDALVEVCLCSLCTGSTVNLAKYFYCFVSNIFQNKWILSPPTSVADRRSPCYKWYFYQFCFKQLTLVTVVRIGPTILESWTELLSTGNMSVVISNDQGAAEQSDGNLKEASG